MLNAKTLHLVRKVYYCVLYHSHNAQPLFPCTAFRQWVCLTEA